MKKTSFEIFTPAEYRYPAAFGFLPNLHLYLHENEIHPMLLIIPGGGYRFVSPSEAENVALRFYALGYHTAVLTYTTDILRLAPLGRQPLNDIARAVRLLRSRADEFGLASGRLALCGFSAGAHLCASLCVHHPDAAEPLPALRAISCRPDAALLCYPVITSGEFAHRDSFTALLGSSPAIEQLRYCSMETQVTPDTPPCFLWQTLTDASVPAENSILFAKALRKNGVRTALHLFSQGMHGLSLGTPEWANGQYGEEYTLAQTLAAIREVRGGGLSVSSEVMASLARFDEPEAKQAILASNHAEPEATNWPELADAWLRETFSPSR